MKDGDRGVDLTSFLTARNRVSGLLHVRFGSEADMARSNCDVRFTPESGHLTTQ